MYEEIKLIKRIEILEEKVNRLEQSIDLINIKKPKAKISKIDDTFISDLKTNPDKIKDLTGNNLDSIFKKLNVSGYSSKNVSEKKQMLKDYFSGNLNQKTKILEIDENFISNLKTKKNKLEEIDITVHSLKKICKKINIKKYSNLKKPKLVKLIINYLDNQKPENKDENVSVNDEFLNHLRQNRNDVKLLKGKKLMGTCKIMHISTTGWSVEQLQNQIINEFEHEDFMSR